MVRGQAPEVSQSEFDFPLCLCLQDLGCFFHAYSPLKARGQDNRPKMPEGDLRSVGGIKEKL